MTAQGIPGVREHAPAFAPQICRGKKPQNRGTSERAERKAAALVTWTAGLNFRSAPNPCWAWDPCEDQCPAARYIRVGETRPSKRFAV